MEQVTKALAFKVVAKAERAEKRYVYGYASVIETKEGQSIVDLQGDMIDADTLEDAAAGFVKQFRQGGEQHEGGAPNDLIASIVLTREIQKALGIPEGALPVGWFVGFELTPDSAEKVKSGDLLWFSIEGECDREAA